MELTINQGKYNIPGVHYIDGAYNFCFEIAGDNCECEILLISIEKRKIEKRISIEKKYMIGNLCCVSIGGIDDTKYGYLFCVDKEVFVDPSAKKIYGREKWADEKRLSELTGKDTKNAGSKVSLFAGFHRQKSFETSNLYLNKEDIVMYHLNVRSFTAAENSKDRGTFSALKRKIPYLKKLGITALSLMPVYEFEEWIVQKDAVCDHYGWDVRENDMISPFKSGEDSAKVNMWGYTDGYYFAPKSSYAYSSDAESEFKELVKKCHDEGIMVIMDIFADGDVNPVYVCDAIRYWVAEYKIDGFTLLGDGINRDILLADPLLKKTYFFNMYFTDEQIEKDVYGRLFIQNEEYMYVMRKLLATRQANMSEAYAQIKKQGEKVGYVNYITYHNGFTLRDLFSYSMKHNEENGEHNHDGNDYNFSTNCGIEGESRKKSILKKRMKSIYNATALMVISQAVPMFLEGDERGNSKSGNNNTYCQDNEIGWVSWKKNKTAEEIYDFTSNILKFRKEHGMIRRPYPMISKDSIGCGMPDVSIHGKAAWTGEIGWNDMDAGICYCGAFCGDKEDVYMAFNFSNSLTKLALPEEPSKTGWEIVMNTALDKPFAVDSKEKHKGSIQVDPYSIILLTAKRKQEKKS